MGAEAAAALAAAFLRDTTANVVLAGRHVPIQSVVAYAPAGSKLLLQPLLAPGTSLLLADGHGMDAPGVAGFGCALLQAIERLLGAGHAATITHLPVLVEGVLRPPSSHPRPRPMKTSGRPGAHSGTLAQCLSYGSSPMTSPW